MLTSLLHSWACIQYPTDVSVSFLVVENDAKALSKEIVQNLRPKFTESDLQYVLENELGIPFARNRAAREALNINSDLLLFVDDDEEVDPDWLENMIAGYRNSKALLIGAPLRARQPKAPLSLMQKLMFLNLRCRYAQKETRAARRGSLDGTPGVTIVTNNWLAHTSLFSKHNIWFDESMRHTGGTDAKFYSEVISRNLPTAWVHDAFVYETVPPERLSFRYQYQRARDQSNTNFRRKNNGAVRLNLFFMTSILLKSIAVIGLLLTIPLTAGRTLLTLARTCGWIAGRCRAIFGSRSKLYSTITGN